MKRLLFWGFKPPRDLASTAFGSLERRVMDVVWDCGSASVREVHAALDAEIAYTTVMTTLDRLYKKGVLRRSRVGRAFVYAPTASRDELGQSVAADILDGLLAQGPEAAQPILSSLVDCVGDRDRLLLDELDRLVREKRRQLRRSEPR